MHCAAYREAALSFVMVLAHHELRLPDTHLVRWLAAHALPGAGRKAAI